jgi:hypothetical protein
MPCEPTIELVQCLQAMPMWLALACLGPNHGLPVQNEPQGAWVLIDKVVCGKGELGSFVHTCTENADYNKIYTILSLQ